jgi:DNA-binding PucR family transcriptional regulator
VVLLDRFLQKIACAGLDEGQTDRILAQIRQYESQISQIRNKEIWVPQHHPFSDHAEVYHGIWPVRGGGDLLGYLVIRSSVQRLPANMRIILDYALNIYAIQFIKHKIVMDTYDQLKDNFIGHFLDAARLDEHTLLQYSHLLNWQVMKPHVVAVVYIELEEEKEESVDVLDLEAQKSFIWDKLKADLSVDYNDLLFTRKNQHLVLISPVKDDQHPQRYWQKLYRRLNQAVQKENPMAKVFLGIGDSTTSLEDYPKSFKQALQAVQVVRQRFRTIGYAFFNQLGSYTVLYQYSSPEAQLFVDRYLSPLLNHEGSKGVNLIRTLQVYLENNGNLKKTAEQLFIHRSTLQYRLERIANILDIDLSDAEETFNLMLALKLYELNQN